MAEFSGNLSFWSFPDKSVDDASNYCRNPNKLVDGLWCYIADNIMDLCDIPFCLGYIYMLIIFHNYGQWENIKGVEKNQIYFDSGDYKINLQTNA